MAFHNTNWEATTLSGTQSSNIHGDGVTAQTTHRIYCLSTGNISITPCAGNQFTWSGTTNSYIDMCVRSTTVNSGSFLAIRGRHTPIQFFNPMTMQEPT